MCANLRGSWCILRAYPSPCWHASPNVRSFLRLLLGVCWRWSGLWDLCWMFFCCYVTFSDRLRSDEYNSIRLLFLRPWCFLLPVCGYPGASALSYWQFSPIVHQTRCGLCWGCGAAVPLSELVSSWVQGWDLQRKRAEGLQVGYGHFRKGCDVNKGRRFKAPTNGKMFTLARMRLSFRAWRSVGRASAHIVKSGSCSENNFLCIQGCFMTKSTSHSHVESAKTQPVMIIASQHGGARCKILSFQSATSSQSKGLQQS